MGELWTYYTSPKRGGLTYGSLLYFDTSTASEPMCIPRTQRGGSLLHSLDKTKELSFNDETRLAYLIDDKTRLS
jgi:hypothetical protein